MSRDLHESVQRACCTRSSCLFVALAAALCGCGETRIDTAGPVPGPTIEFGGVGLLPGDVSSQATAVSADGTTIVGSSRSADGRSQAFRWNATSRIVALGRLVGGTTSNARAVSSDGSVVVGDGDGSGSSGFKVFRWTSAGMVALTSLGNSGLCHAGGVSGDGSIVVGTCVTTNNAAFRWTQTTGMVSIGQFGTGSNRTSNALAIASSGNTIVGAGHPVLTGAVSWNAANDATILGFLPGDNAAAAATAASRDGTVIVGYSTDPAQRQRGFRWNRENGVTSIAAGLDVVSNSVASGVSGNGQTIVGRATAADGDVAFIWDAAHGMRRLDHALKSDYGATISDWRLSCASGISDDGRVIVGTGINPNGVTEGWWLKLP